jgi:hypothetical protein
VLKATDGSVLYVGAPSCWCVCRPRLYVLYVSTSALKAMDGCTVRRRTQLLVRMSPSPSSTSLLAPKSVTTRCPRPVTSTFSGFRSRCTIPSRCSSAALAPLSACPRASTSSACPHVQRRGTRGTRPPPPSPHTHDLRHSRASDYSGFIYIYIYIYIYIHTYIFIIRKP